MSSGDIVLIQWPFTDLSGIKRRPPLVLYANEYDDLLLLFITSQKPQQITGSNFILQPTKTNRLKAISYLRFDKIISLHASQSTGIIGKISEPDFNDITEAFATFIRKLVYT